MADNDKGEDILSGKLHEKVIDMEWVTAIEDTLPYIEKAIDEQRRFIIENNEVYRIDKAKIINKDSVKHLIQHTNFIDNIDERGKVTPNRVLTIEREDSFETYENRFLITLIENALAFVADKYRKMVDAPTDTYNKVEMERDLVLNNQHVTFKMEYSNEVKDAKAADLDVKDFEKLSDFDRVRRIREKLNSFLNTDMMMALKKCIRVKPPINRTNLMTKNPNYEAGLDLFTYLGAYNKPGYEIIGRDFSGKMDKAVQEAVYISQGFQHFMITIATNPALKRMLEERYQENKTGHGKAGDSELEAMIENVRKEEMKIRLQEIREREKIIRDQKSQIAALKREIEKRDKQIETLKSTIKALEDRIRELEKELQQVKAELIKAKERIAELEARVAELEARVAALEAQVAALTATVAKLEQVKAELEAKIVELEKIIAEQKAKLAEQERIIAAQRNRINELEAYVAELEKTKAMLESRVTALETENAQQKATIQQHEATIATQIAAIAGLETEIASAKSQITELSGTLAQRDETIASQTERIQQFEFYVRSKEPTIYLRADSRLCAKAETNGSIFTVITDKTNSKKSAYGDFNVDALVGAMRVSFIAEACNAVTQNWIPENETSRLDYTNVTVRSPAVKQLLWVPRPDVKLNIPAEKGNITNWYLSEVRSGATYQNSYYKNKDDNSGLQFVSNDTDSKTVVSPSPVTGQHPTLGANRNLSDFSSLQDFERETVTLPIKDNNSFTDTYYLTKITMNIWIEGTDSEARRAMDGGEFNLILTFSGT